MGEDQSIMGAWFDMCEIWGGVQCKLVFTWIFITSMLTTDA